MRIGAQMLEVLQHHTDLRGQQAKQRCIDWLEQVRIPQAANRIRQYPHELSGGMRQRVMIAMAMLCEPELLIADEPTTALDVTVQADILDLMDELRRNNGTAIALITHDMGVVARMCDRVQVMRTGEFVESGSAEDVFYRPQHDYTKMLLEAVPRIELEAKRNNANRESDTQSNVILDVNELSVQFNIRGALFKPATQLQAVNKVSFQLLAGETLAIVGESGSGKSTLARAVLNLIPSYTGSVSWLGQSIGGLAEKQFKFLRRDLQIVFQDPLASLNPTMTVGESIMEPLKVFEPKMSGKLQRERIISVMAKVGLDASFLNRYPHELSGGQNQRVGIARAIILEPKLIICDEAVSALDVSVQAQVLALLQSLQQELDLSFIFISHDLSVVWEIADRVLVLYKGNVVEIADTKTLFSNPQQPYTKNLLEAIPIPDPAYERKRMRQRLHNVANHGTNSSS